MNFALILFLATVFTGAIALVDRLVFAKQRKRVEPAALTKPFQRGEN